MKKIISFWPMAMMLLFGAVCFTACGDDDDDSGSGNSNEQSQSGGGNSDQNLVPDGYYGIIYVYDNEEYYGNLDYELQSNVRVASAMGDIVYIKNYSFISNWEQGNAAYLGYYVFTRNGEKYIVGLWNTVSRDQTNATYFTRTYPYQGGSVTVYFNLNSLDPGNFQPLDRVQNVSYKDGVMTLDGTHFKRFSFTGKVDLLEEWCDDLVDDFKKNNSY